MFYQNEEDETLVMLTLAGEQRAYEALVIRYQKMVTLSVAAVTKNYYLAEDAAQDAFVTAWMKLNTLQDAKKYGAWVCRIAKNCALNMISRYRSFLPLDEVENINIAGDVSQNPAELYVLSEEKEELNKSIGKLPERIKQIICLHYFEGLSIAEIADRMRISEGTVKWQLHDGRKRIRKELCAMNEEYNDALVQRVMKKVEELKLWKFKNNKSGFEVVYKDVLREVEEMPECIEKQHALADVLMRGWWWIPGKKNDALMARIADAAINGKNEEVMSFIVNREDSQIYGEARIEFIRDKQIPRLKNAGFVTALAREWYNLGYCYFREGKAEEGRAAYDEAMRLFDSSDVYRSLIPLALNMEQKLSTAYKEKDIKRFIIKGDAEEYRYIDGLLRYWSGEGFLNGKYYSFGDLYGGIFRNSSKCDGRFFADIDVGESFFGSDGTELTYVSDSEMVKAPSGTFCGCQLWKTTFYSDSDKYVCKSYYKDGVGIVRHEFCSSGISNAFVLKTYNIVGGKGLLPIEKGNTWEYAYEYNPDAIAFEHKYSVTYADSSKVIISSFKEIERKKYDDNSWLDMIEQIRNDYVGETKDGNQYIRDVYHAIERAELLASTPMQKAHTKAATSVARRILSTDINFNPECESIGRWNFFSKSSVKKDVGKLSVSYDFKWSFEWKNAYDLGVEGWPLLCNDIYDILQDAANCIWSDEWQMSESLIVEYSSRYGSDIKTSIKCDNGGTVATKAGTFENCLKLCLNIEGMSDGVDYRGGKKTYYFAEGVGIVRTENEYRDGLKTAVYELTSYEGTGDGYMPVADGLVRRYDAIGLTDGYVGAAEYTYVADDNGDIVIFADKTGIRERFSQITRYGFIQGEVIEDSLWDAGKHDESRLRHDINTFNLLCHFLFRPTRSYGVPEKAVAWNKYRLHILESLNGASQIPPAWRGFYAETTLRTACALFGCGKKEEGYEWLDKAFDAAPKWDEISAGTEMEAGSEFFFNSIKVVKGTGIIKLPDGTAETAEYRYEFADFKKCDFIYYAMTAPRGWEWFDPVRNEERFKQYVERAKKLMNK